MIIKIKNSDNNSNNKTNCSGNDDNTSYSDNTNFRVLWRGIEDAEHSMPRIVFIDFIAFGWPSNSGSTHEKWDSYHFPFSKWPSTRVFWVHFGPSLGPKIAKGQLPKLKLMKSSAAIWVPLGTHMCRKPNPVTPQPGNEKTSARRNKSPWLWIAPSGPWEWFANIRRHDIRDFTVATSWLFNMIKLASYLGLCENIMPYPVSYSFLQIQPPKVES